MKSLQAIVERWKKWRARKQAKLNHKAILDSMRMTFNEEKDRPKE